jgi:hypothetical protein
MNHEFSMADVWTVNNYFVLELAEEIDASSPHTNVISFQDRLDLTQEVARIVDQENLLASHKNQPTTTTTTERSSRPHLWAF